MAARLPGKVSIGSHGYAQVFADGRMELLHRWVLGLVVGDRLIGDHIDRDPLNCQRQNLRAVTPAESNLNRVLPYRRALPEGVYQRKGSSRFNAHFQRNRRRVYLGSFDTVTEAESAVLAAKSSDRIKPPPGAL